MTEKSIAKKAFKFPHTLVILLSLMVFCVVLSWIVPAGEYARVKNDAGITMVVADSFRYVESKAISVLAIPDYIVKGFKVGFSLILMILFSGCAFEVIVESGALHAAIGKATKKFGNKEALFIPALATVAAIIGSNQSQNVFIGFAPVLVMAARSMGFDSITGLAIIICGGGIGWSTGTVSAASTGIAQQIAELPLFSGTGYRVLAFVIFHTVTCAYLIHYARKVKKNPELSPMYDIDSANPIERVDLNAYGDISARHIILLCMLGAALVSMIVGGIKWKWNMDKFTAIFIWLGFVGGLVARMSLSEIASCFVKGGKRMVQSILIIGFARTISVLLSGGGIMDTVVHALASALMYFPRSLQSIAMLFANYIVNFFVISGSGQAAIVMPVFTPVADMIGMTRQTAVLAYIFGDGFSNYIYPTSTSLMALTAAVGIPYDRWIRFIWKLFLIWTLICCIMLFIAQMINYGPM